MKQSEVIALSDSELKDALERTKKSYSDLKMAHAVTPLENPIQLRTVRRSIARIKTEITKRELQASK